MSKPTQSKKQKVEAAESKRQEAREDEAAERREEVRDAVAALKVSRTETARDADETAAKQASPAGTPTAASAQEAPSPRLAEAATTVKPAVGESLPRTSGAGWFIPPQKPSQFGTKGN